MTPGFAQRIYRVHDEKDFDLERTEALLPERSSLGIEFESAWLITMMALDGARTVADEIMTMRDIDPALYEGLIGKTLGATPKQPTEDGGHSRHIGLSVYGDQNVPVRMTWHRNSLGACRWVFLFAEIPMAARWAPSGNPADIDGSGSLQLLTGRSPWAPSTRLLKLVSADCSMEVVDVIRDAAAHLADTAKRALKDITSGVHGEAFAQSQARQLMLRLDASSSETMRTRTG